MRTRIVLTALGAAAALLPAAASAVVYTPITMPACGGAVTKYCIVSLERNGNPETIARTGMAPFYTYASRSIPGTHPVSFAFDSVDIYTAAGPVDLNPADTWRIVLNTGSLSPAEVLGRMRDATVERGGNATDGYTVAVTGRPVRMAYTDSGCGGTGVCPAVADTLNTGVFNFQVDDGTAFDDPVDTAAVQGFSFMSSTDWFSSLPRLDYATNTIKIDVANSHFEPDGATVFVGSAELHMPYAMMRRLYDIDSPATLVPSVFTIAGASGATTSLSVGADAVDVRITGLTFSKRSLRVTGRPVPRAPRNISALRLDSGRGRIRFAPALPRGSKVRGYVASCTATGLPKVVKNVPVQQVIVVTGLSAGRRYTCTVRAKSRAGLGSGARVTIPARAS